MTDDSRPTPTAISSSSGSSSVVPAVPMPTGSMTTAPTMLATASPDEPEKRRPVAPLSTM